MYVTTLAQWCLGQDIFCVQWLCMSSNLLIVKRQHVKVSLRYWSSTIQMSSTQNQFPISHYPFSDKIGNNNSIHTTWNVTHPCRARSTEHVYNIWKHTTLKSNTLKIKSPPNNTTYTMHFDSNQTMQFSDNVKCSVNYEFQDTSDFSDLLLDNLVLWTIENVDSLKFLDILELYYLTSTNQ